MSNFWHSIGKGLEKTVNWFPHTGKAEKKAAMEATRQQIDYYKTAKEDLEKTRLENENEKKEQRNKINEKEIRSRQRLYRRSGFMEQPAPGVKESLG